MGTTQHRSQQLRARGIQQLSEQGLTDESIAQQLGRSTNAIRNLRHRNNIKTSETQTIQQLHQEKHNLTQQTQELEQRLNQLDRKRNQLKTALQTEDQELKNKLEAELIQLKNKKPELFQITGEEQLAKLTAQLATSFIRWLIE
ncbi:hypothetical protein E4H04_10915 [Candidatus Bathyarchaeota archaeon]|nr:MAG: hypothetical protein E4H04_10915 [Candidatus Bathyarchaeota archaeon]